MSQSLDDPEIRRRTVRALLITAPFLFVGSYALAAAQGAAGKHALLIAVVALLMCLGTAACIHLMGSKSGIVASILALLLALFGR